MVLTFDISKNNSNCIKFISAWLIVLHHYSQYVCRDWPIGEAKNLLYYFFFSFHLEAGYVGVAIFFFLSGYGLMESDRKNHLTIMPFLRKRLSKIYLPAILVSVIWIPIYYVCVNKDSFRWYQIPYDLLWGFQDGAMWFINVLLFLYLSFAIYAKLLRTKEWSANIIFILLVALIALATRYMKGCFAMIGIPMFLIGVYVSNCKYHQQNVAIKAIVPMIASLGTIALYLFVSFGRGKLALIACAIFAYLVVYALIIVFSNNKRDLKFPAILGALSFDIYLVHNKVLTILCTNERVCSLYGYLIVVTIVTVLFYVLRNNALTRMLDNK